MPNRMMAFGVLLFSFALALFGFQQKTDAPTLSYDRDFHVPVMTFPVQTYWVIGAIAIAGSLFFMVLAFRKDWSEPVQNFMTRYIYLPVSLLLWLLYTLTFLKGLAVILSISPPAWIVYLVFYSGFVLFLVIPVLFFKEWFKSMKKVSPTRKLSK